MIKVISGFEYRYIVNRTITSTSKNKIQIKKTCDNCYVDLELCNMSNGLQCCLECSKDIEALTNRLPFKTERD